MVWNQGGHRSNISEKLDKFRRAAGSGVRLEVDAGVPGLKALIFFCCISPV